MKLPLDQTLAFETGEEARHRTAAHPRLVGQLGGSCAPARPFPEFDSLQEQQDDKPGLGHILAGEVGIESRQNIASRAQEKIAGLHSRGVEFRIFARHRVDQIKE